MFRSLLHILSAAFLFWIICRLAGSRRGGEAGPGEGPREMAQDALTGVYFPKSAAVKVVRGGETLYFQNLENRDKFLSARRG